MIYELVETSRFGKGATIVPIVLPTNYYFGETRPGDMCVEHDNQDLKGWEEFTHIE